MNKLLIVILLLAIIPISASAETGNITVTQEVTKNYLESAGVAGANIVQQFYINSANYNKLSFLRVERSNGNFTATKSFNSSAFTITGGGSGTGVFYYDMTVKNATSGHYGRLYWVCDGYCDITNNDVTYTLDTNILTEVVGEQCRSSGNISADRPVNVYCQTGPSLTLTNVYYHAEVASSSVDSYNVTYPLSGKFNVHIEKDINGESINKKYIIHGDATTYATELTYNTNDFDFFGDYDDGLWLNATVSTGAFTDTLVNATGSTQPTPTPTPPSIPSGDEGVIQFDATTYTEGDNAVITWNIGDSAFLDFLYTKRIYVLKDGVSQVLLVNPAQSGTYTYNSISAGSWEVKLTKTLISETVLGTDTALVTPEQASYLQNNATYPAKVSVTIPFYLGYNPATDTAVYLKINRFDPVTETYVKETSNLIQYSGVTSGFNNFSAVQFFTTGTYNIELRDSVRGTLLDSEIVTTYLSPTPVTNNITTSTISVDQSSYFWGDYIYVDYQIDNTNWTNHAVYLDFYSVDNDLIEAYFQGGIEQTAKDYYVGIRNIPASEGAIAQTFYTGNNTARLVYYNTTTASIQVVATTSNFTISQINTAGYGLILKKSEACVNEVVPIKVITPGQANVKIIREPDGTVVKNVTINNSLTFGYKFQSPTTYTIHLYSLSPDLLQNSQSVSISSCVAPTATPSIQTGEEVLGLLQTNVFWALLITVGIMISLAYATEAGPFRRRD